MNRENIRNAGTLGGALGGFGMAMFLLPVAAGPLGAAAALGAAVVGGTCGRFGAGDHTNNVLDAVALGFAEGGVVTIAANSVIQALFPGPMYPPFPRPVQCSKCKKWYVPGIDRHKCN